MNGLTVMLIAFVALGFGYFIYSKWLEKTWGIDPKQPTPAVKNAGGDYAPASKWTVAAHQFTSITGAGPDYCRHVWLASRAALDADRRRVFRRRSGFCIHVCVCQK